MRWLRRLTSLFRKQRLEKELDEELAFHLEMRERQFLDQGLPLDEARRAARRRLGNRTTVQEDCRQFWGFQLLEELVRDLKFACMLLLKDRTFTFAAMLTLALGIGLNAAFFTVFSTVALKPYAVRDPDSLFLIQFKNQQGDTVRLTERELLVGDIPGVSAVVTSRTINTGVDGVSSHGTLVSGNLFTELGAPMVLGRPITTNDRTAVAVLSERAWSQRFGRDPDIVGRVVTIHGEPWEVVGVAASTFTGLDLIAPDFWAPHLVWEEAGLPGFSAAMTGRLQSGVTEQRAEEMLASYGRQLTEDRDPSGRISRAELISNAMPATMSAPELLLPIVIVFLMTMAVPCANAANMMLARAMARQQELGIRLSLGASRGRIIRQLLAEGFLIAAAAATSGVLLAQIAVDLGQRAWYASAPEAVVAYFPLPEISIDFRVYGYLALVVCATTLLCALAPAAQATQAVIAASVRAKPGTWRSGRMRDALVVGQVAVCAVLLVATGVALRTGYRLSSVDLGFDPSGVYALAFSPQEIDQEVAGELRQQPWVETLAFSWPTPEEVRPVQLGQRAAGYRNVSPSYLELMRIPLLRGRDFTEAEAAARADVTIVTDSLARSLWPGRDALGESVTATFGNTERQLRIIGVARDFAGDPARPESAAVLLLPMTLASDNAMLVMVRGNLPPAETRIQFEALLARRPNQGERVAAVQDVFDFASYPHRVASWLGLLLGGLSLVLAATGIYGVTNYLIGQRTKEIGIRIALGATGRQASQFAFSYVGRMAALGLVVGMVVPIAGMRYLSSQAPIMIDIADPLPYLAALAVLAAAALLAAAGPARRASRVDPMDVLRMD